MHGLPVEYRKQMVYKKQTQKINSSEHCMDFFPYLSSYQLDYLNAFLKTTDHSDPYFD